MIKIIHSSSSTRFEINMSRGILAATYLLLTFGMFGMPKMVVFAINPFKNGCLKAMAERHNHTERKFEVRVCNSDDLGTNNKVCRAPKLDNYFEVRTAPCDWDEGMTNIYIYIIYIYIFFFSQTYILYPLK